jgi:hypothetical protein
MNYEAKPILPEGAGPLGPHAYDAPRTGVAEGTFHPPYPEDTFKPEAPEAPVPYVNRNIEREVSASDRMLGRIAAGMPEDAAEWMKAQERGEGIDAKTKQRVPLYADVYGKPTTVEPAIPAIYYERPAAPTAEGFGPQGLPTAGQAELPKATQTTKIRGGEIDSYADLPEVHPADARIVRNRSGNQSARVFPQPNAWQVGRPNHRRP